MDKNIFEIASVGDNDSREYWRKKSYLERLEALEQLRQIAFGYGPTTARLQRVLTITKLKED